MTLSESHVVTKFHFAFYFSTNPLCFLHRFLALRHHVTQLINLKNARTHEPVFTFDLEHAAGTTGLTFHATVRMDESKLRGPLEEERWLLLELLAEQVNIVLESHRRASL